MNLFPKGVVLPFQKGNAPKNTIEHFQVQTAVRVPLVRPDIDTPVPTLPFDEDAPIARGSVLYAEEGELPVLAPISSRFGGTVVLQHPQYGKLLCAELIPVEGDEEETLPVIPAEELTAEDIIHIAQDAAIYDELDGIPLAEKLVGWQLVPNDTVAPFCVLVADATENDVFGSAAWAVLAEEAEDALNGLQFAARALNFTRYHIATMLPKAQRRALHHAIGRVNVYTVDDEYPVTQYADDRDEVFRIGVQACIALAKAIKHGQKSLTTVITVAGDDLLASRNLRVPYGTDINDILCQCDASATADVVLGDAMTGIACPDTRTPLLPGTTTLLAMKPRALRVAKPCIGCGRCAAVCHAKLLPYEIVRRAENMHYERLRRLTAQLCDGCGACSYVCPSDRDVAAAVLHAGESTGPVFLNWGDDDDEQ
jgi:Na+-translocating ferredoxin:NAD+ oxidoreductase RnfC subunit